MAKRILMAGAWPTGCVVVLLAVITSVGSWLGFSRLMMPDGDAIQYDTLGWNLAQGHGFSLATVPPFAPTMYREPFYPAWLALLYRLSGGHRPDLVPWFQVGWFVATCLLAYGLGRWLVHEQAGRWAGIAAACCPTLANYPSYLLTESVATCLLIGAIGAVCVWWARQTALWAALAGLVLGCLSLCKVVMLPLVICLAVGGCISRHATSPRARRMAHMALMFLACAMVVTPWVARNYRVFGSAQVSLRGGLALWARANRLTNGPRELAQTAVYSFSEVLGHALFPDAAATPSEVVLRDSHLVNERLRMLMEQGLTQETANQRLGQEAVQQIVRHPVAYVLQTPIEMIQMTAFSYVPGLNELQVSERMGRHPSGRLLLSGVRGMVRLLAYPLLGLVAYGWWSCRRNWRQWWPIAVALVYVNAVHALLFGYGRYAVPLIPLYLIVAAMGVWTWHERRQPAAEL